MNSETFWTIKAMRTFGGSFVRALGYAAALADEENLTRIIAAWPEYWKQYTAMGEHIKEQENLKTRQSFP